MGWPKGKSRSVESRAKSSAGMRFNAIMGARKQHPNKRTPEDERLESEGPWVAPPGPVTSGERVVRTRVQLVEELEVVFRLAETMCWGEVPPSSIADWQEWVRAVRADLYRALAV